MTSEAEHIVVERRFYVGAHGKRRLVAGIMLPPLAASLTSAISAVASADDFAWHIVSILACILSGIWLCGAYVTCSRANWFRANFQVDSEGIKKSSYGRDEQKGRWLDLERIVADGGLDFGGGFCLEIEPEYPFHGELVEYSLTACSKLLPQEKFERIRRSRGSILPDKTRDRRIALYFGLIYGAIMVEWVTLNYFPNYLLAASLGILAIGALALVPWMRSFRGK